MAGAAVVLALATMLVVASAVNGLHRVPLKGMPRTRDSLRALGARLVARDLGEVAREGRDDRGRLHVAGWRPRRGVEDPQLVGADPHLVARAQLGRRAQERLKLERGKALWFPGCVLALTALTLGGQVLLSTLLSQAGGQPGEQQLLVQAAASGGALFYLSVALFAPLGEEIVFRRLMFGAVAHSSGRFAAYALTSLLFAVIHLNFASFPLYLYMAICYALAYELTGSVWGAVSVHALNNTVALFGIS